MLHDLKNVMLVVIQAVPFFKSNFTPQHTYFEQSAACLSVFFMVTSWFDIVCNIVTRWVNFSENH